MKLSVKILHLLGFGKNTFHFLNILIFVTENASSANTSSSTSRRNSSNSTLKCDNVTKYPDKKQIEDKLNQIREYLKITNSLMTNIKNTDEQVSL